MNGTLKPLGGRANIGSGTIGWLEDMITKMQEQRRWAFAVNNCADIIINEASPLILSAAGQGTLYSACTLAAQGSSTKVQAFAQVAAVPIDVTLSLVSTKVFGTRIRISDTMLNFNPGQFTITFFDNVITNKTGTITVLPRRNVAPIDIIMLAINNNGGQASVTDYTTPRVLFTAATSTAVGSSTIYRAETLNMRDLENDAVMGRVS